MKIKFKKITHPSFPKFFIGNPVLSMFLTLCSSLFTFRCFPLLSAALLLSSPLYAAPFQIQTSTSSAGASLNKENMIAIAKLPKSPDKNQLRRTVRPGTVFTVLSSTPTKIFTPNGDGINDTFNLTFDNPNGSIISEKKILDLTGAEVADMQVIGDETASPVTLIWDGRNNNGDYVRSGIYIYQVQSEGKVINGTIVVAR